ncbi:MAG: hypothetical protein EZS28_036215 [Streblomastix strix]|uniref:Uncharacterized protein n=1 Tax=Streblomastix strix TaxID=222440 RepID=A0A5J4UCL3_9EUKA|nr:MAG: hypothetical protein EZS28_036215 [Streblomastix strix]
MGNNLEISALSLYKLGTHPNQEVYRLRLNVRNDSRYCLRQIQIYGDEQDFADLVNVEYGRVLSIAFCTAGGIGEEQDVEIKDVLNYISIFLKELHEGRIYYQPFFQPLPLLVRRTEEQIEEEGANEELEAQMENNGFYLNSIRNWANRAKANSLNHFIHRD